jgi:cell division protein FtsQ
MQKKTLTTIFVSLGILGVIGYVVFAAFLFSLNEKNVRCKNLDIRVSGKVKMLTKEEISEIIQKKGIHPVGMPLSAIRTDRIEKGLLKNDMIREAFCYHDPRGNVSLLVRLREPKYMILGSKNFYVDTDRKLFPVSMNQLAYVPVVTGVVTRGFAKNELYNFVDFISAHPFWNDQIEQIHVRAQDKVELVPRVGDAIILMGSLDNFEDKLLRVERLYRKAFSEMGWNRYVLLDLRYDNQLVAVKRKQSKGEI